MGCGKPQASILPCLKLRATVLTLLARSSFYGEIGQPAVWGIRVVEFIVCRYSGVFRMIVLGICTRLPHMTHNLNNLKGVVYGSI